MCGFIAAWDPSGLTVASLESALMTMSHRGPDTRGLLWRKDNQVCLAHVRLKVIDVSESANQPFVSPCGRWALAFNGEIYNFKELRAEINDRWEWRTSGDTEVLMAAWSLWGPACLDKLVGMFAFAIHDDQLGELTLVRDRFGIKPLYRIISGNAFFFASEIPPLLRFYQKWRPTTLLY